MRISAAIVLAFCAAASVQAAEQIDLSKLDRTIGNEPKYTSDQPLYGLVVIGSSASTRVWMVLDKTEADNEHYDVLYVDRNGNGDLTDAREKITKKVGRFGTVKFDLYDFIDPQTDDKDTEFNLSVSNRNPATHMVSLKWRGEHKFGGGYPADPNDGYMRFDTSVEKAPIVWLNADGPFQFQRWFSRELQIGGDDDLKLFLGLPGVGM